MLYLGKSLVALHHNLSQGARLSLLFTSILSLFTFLFQTSDIKFEKRRNGEYEQIEIKKFRNGWIAQPILLILNQQKTDVIRNRISIQMALR